MQVREALMTSAQLRLPQSMPLSEKQARVDQIIIELVCAASIIGSWPDGYNDTAYADKLMLQPQTLLVPETE